MCYNTHYQYGLRPDRKDGYSMDLEQCLQQEQLYQFRNFSHADAWELGCALVSACAEMEGPLAVEIELNHVLIFRFYPDGTGKFHEQWLRRKRNIVNTMEKSSLRCKFELAQSGEDLARDWCLDPMQYAACGGGFPIRLRGGSVIGAIAVSGLPDLRDHAALIEGLRRYFEKYPQ